MSVWTARACIVWGALDGTNRLFVVGMQWLASFETDASAGSAYMLLAMLATPLVSALALGGGLVLAAQIDTAARARSDVGSSGGRRGEA